MNSLERRLIASIVVATLVLSAASGVLLYRSTRADLLWQFDQSLAAQAEALSAQVSVDAAGKIDFEIVADAMPNVTH